ncbi:hypothetical protein [Candidatus Rhabdochlamydia sp. T3358]|uniref:hypothetical protein n=1 Tax=Candidatus Rhabdochlamydia sp. T3358 TaxID=2099795 RepID=UPI0010B51775|nr:hypothetical protein [Candidatus Rhabdochlamydia sp. T3358]VHO04709.1 hypothetical protein RHT_01469 [Candidatus Rhabdochlamydia sp. T3358]
MAQIILTSAAWYALPKGIDYLTSRPSSLESRVSRVRARLFIYKSTLSELANTNPLIKNLRGTVSIYCSNMWLAILIAPIFQKIIPVKGLDYIFWRVFTCHMLFACKLSKPNCIKFMSSDAALEYMTSLWGLRCINILSSLDFTKVRTLRFIRSLLPECLASDQLISILDKRLRHLDAYDLLRATNLSVRLEEGTIRSEVDGRYDTSLIPLDRVQLYDQSAADELFDSIFSAAARTINIATNEGIRANELEGALSMNFLDSMLIQIGMSIIDRIKSRRHYIANMQSVLQELPNYAEDIYDTDPILNQIQCPISLRAIRRTITDPTNEKTVYDYESFKIWLEHSRTSPITREEIPENFDVKYEGGSRYDSILRYRKALLQSGELQNSEEEEFIANLKQIFEEICTLNKASDIKTASEMVRDFFQKGVLDAYDISYLNTLDSCEACKRRHNQDLNDRKEETFQSISLQEIDQSRFIINELNLEIEKIKTKKEELIEAFANPTPEASSSLH